jgi:hypothetical protein
VQLRVRQLARRVARRRSRLTFAAAARRKASSYLRKKDLRAVPPTVDFRAQKIDH